MAVGKVTQDSVNALRPGAKDQFLWDDKLPGFGVKVTPKGARVYLYQYRIGGRGHPTKRVKIGDVGAMKAAKAREVAEAYYAKVRQGEDVAAQAREKKRIAVDLAFDAYLDGFADTTLKAKWPRSWQRTKARLEQHAGKHWGSKPLPNITADDVRRVLRNLDHQPAAKRNLFAALSFLFNQSVKDGVLASSPLKNIEPPRPVDERSRTLNDDELRWLWNALQEEVEPYRGFVQDLIFTGQRRGEVAELPWSELSRDRREWHLPASRAKNGCANIIPLTDKMVARLDALAGYEKWPRSGLVRASREGTPISTFSKLKLRLDARMAKAAKEADAKLEPWRLHDLRRTLATNLQRLGIRHEVVEHLLNHREKTRTGIARVYQLHDFRQEKLHALGRWEAELDRIVSGASAVVVPFERRAKEPAA